MNMHLTRRILSFALLAAAACEARPAQAGWLKDSPSVVPVQLRCEHLVDPLGIDVVKPRLSWKLETGNSKLERGIRQSAYRILVASSEELLKKDKGDLWDSGKVASSASVLVEYAGKPLQSRQPCHWKVMTWVSSGKDAEAEPGVSKPALWTMGLLRPEDFTAKWIGSPTDVAVEPAPLLRKAFALEKDVKRATAYISGLGYYELMLNGKKVGDHELDPKFTRYDKRVLYVTYDVTALIRRGANAAGVMLGNGWYNYHVKNAWDFDTAPWRAKPRLLLQLEVEFADGSTQTLVSDGSWKYATGPILFDGNLSGEVYDARLEKAGWDTAGYDDSAWAAARIVEAPKGRLAAQMVQPIRAIETIKPVKVTQPKPGVYLFDFGQNIAGRAELTVTGLAGTEVKIQYAELLHGDGTLNADNINSFCKNAEFQTERYILKGQGTETWRSRFMYHGFQYAQVTGFPGEPRAESLTAIVLHTDFDSMGAFECSNDLLSRIQHCTRWSYVNNFHGHPTDCPNRERNGWTGDAHLAAETGLYNFDAAAAYTQWMRDFQDEQQPGGSLPGIVPTGGWGYQWGNGPAWDSAYVLIPWYMYLYCGDVGILAEHYENLKRYVDYLTTRAQDGIVGIGLGDWCPAGVATPAAVTSTGYYYCDAVIVSKIAALTGKAGEAAKYSQLADNIRKAFNRKFFKPETKQYDAGTQTALACALYQGLVEPADANGVLRNLVADVEKKGDHLDCGILGTKYLLHALTDNGRVDVAYKVAAQTTQPSWGNWVRQGATTLWEGWGGAGTHNHIMFGDVSAWFFETLAGIQPDPTTPGFRHVIIKPAVVGDPPSQGSSGVTGLTWVKASHDTPYGKVFSRWAIEGAKLTLAIEIPPNTTATVYVPASDAAGVLEGDRPASKAEGIAFQRMDGTFAVFDAGSGSYTFSSIRK